MASLRISRSCRHSLLNPTGRSWPSIGSGAVNLSPAFRPIPRSTRIASVGQPRFASTSTSTNTASSPIVEHASSAEPLITEDLPSSLSSVINSPHIGYLKELGLDYGWGPSSLVQWLCENGQVLFDLPMWAAVPAAVLATRLAVLPLYFKASDTQARMATMGPILKPLQEKARAAALSQDTGAQAQIRKELSEINKRAGIKYRYVFLPILLQMPLGFGLFRVTRGMATLPLPELQSTNMGWLSDLTVADPYYLLPALTAGTIYLTLRAGGEQGEAAGANPTMQYYMRIGMPTLSFLFTFFQPGITQLGFLAGSVWAAIQAQLLKNRGIRSALQIHPLPTKESMAAATRKANAGPTYAGTITRDTTARVVETAAEKPRGWSSVKSKAHERFIKPAQVYMQKQEKKHGRLTKSELKSATAYEARKKRIEQEETAEEKAREDALRRQRLSERMNQ